MRFLDFLTAKDAKVLPAYAKASAAKAKVAKT